MALHRGRIFNTAGDAILAEFGSAVEAVRCATEIQAALRTRNDQLPEERRVQFRIGVNLGDVMVEGGDLLGDGVNVAARLQAAAEPGGICIAGSVYEQIRNKLWLSFKPLGEMNYKNIPQPVRTFAIAEADGIGPLPSPAQRQQTTAARSRFWAAVIAVVLLLAGGAAVWGYSDYRYRQAEAERAAAFAAESRAAEEARRRSEAEAAKAAQQQAAQQQAQAERRRIEDEARRLIEAKRRQPDPAQLAAALPIPMRVAPPSGSPVVSAAVPSGGSTADATGVYRGQICYGPIDAEPARCYRAQAVVTGNRILGEWPGRAPGVTMYLAGGISRSGDVAIYMHGKRADGSHFATGDLAGTLRDGHITANGSFMNGRTVTLNWQKN